MPPLFRCCNPILTQIFCQNKNGGKMTHSFYMKGGRPPHSFVGFCGALKLLQKGARSRVRNPPFGISDEQSQSPAGADINSLQSRSYLPEPNFPRKPHRGFGFAAAFRRRRERALCSFPERAPRQTKEPAGGHCTFSATAAPQPSKKYGTQTAAEQKKKIRATQKNLKNKYQTKN